MLEDPYDKPLPKQPQRKLNGGQKFGLGCGGIALGVPVILWTALLFVTSPGGSGCAECSLGWYAVISGWLAFPALVFALVVFAVASINRSFKSISESSTDTASHDSTKPDSTKSDNEDTE